MNTLIFGLQYGDEAKGRVSAELGKDADWFVRFNGGPNAGHTVYHDGKKFALHHLPAGAITGKKIALDAGMVIDLDILEKELSILPLRPELYISSRAHVIQKRHKESDIGGSGVGSTKKGIAYAYSDKVLRKGTRMGDIDSKILDNLNATVYDGLVPFRRDENVIFESAQGVLLDIDYGNDYPYVTSSSVFPSGYYKIDRRIGVMKGYTTRVGDSRIKREQIDWLTVAGNEYGTTTGRPRQCYWNDLNELQYAMDIGDADEIVVTKLDILEGKGIKIVDYNEKAIDFSTVTGYIDYLRGVFPQIKYLSWAPYGAMQMFV